MIARTLAVTALLLGAPVAIANAVETAATATAPTRPVPFTVAVEIQSLYGRSSAQRLFSGGGTQATAGLSASYDLVRPGERFTVALGAGWLYEENSNLFGSGDHADLETNSLFAMATARYAIFSWLEPQVRLSANVAESRARLGLADGTTLRGDDMSYGAGLGGGFRLRTNLIRLRIGLPDVAFSATFEGGYAFGSKLGLRLSPPRPDDDALASDRIPGASVGLGTLDRSRPYFRTALAMHF